MQTEIDEGDTRSYKHNISSWMGNKTTNTTVATNKTTNTTVATNKTTNTTVCLKILGLLFL